MSDVPHDRRSPMEHERDAGDDLPMRCAECSCDEGGVFCNWIASSSTEYHSALVKQRARIRELEAELASGSFYKETDIDALMARAEANAARLETALAQMQATLDRLTAERDAAPVVKPLEWVKHPTHDIWRCDTRIGTYKVFGIKPPVSWDFDGLSDGGISLSMSKVSQSVQAAKAAAQADYDARIRAALTIAPATVRDDVLDQVVSKVTEHSDVARQKMAECYDAGQAKGALIWSAIVSHLDIVADAIRAMKDAEAALPIAPAPSRDDVREETLAIRDMERLVETAQWARNRLELIADESWHGDARDFKRSLIGVFADFDEALKACGSQVPAAVRIMKGEGR